VRSATPSLVVKLRVTPCSTGTLNSSPRASTTTRLAFGPTRTEAMLSPSAIVCGRSVGRSPGIAMSTGTVCEVANS
jgi:hypothetical protein